VWVVIGVVTEAAVYHFQVRQLDARLVDAGHRNESAFGGPHRPPNGDRDGS